MPRDGSGIYSKPFPDVVAGTTIESTVHNGTVADVETDLNAPRPIIAGGTGATSAKQARDNLDAEVASQTVTSYDSHVWETGSFWSNTGATGAPVNKVLTGYCVIVNNDPNHISLEAIDNTTSTVYRRIKFGGVWGAWTSALTVTAPSPALILNKPASGDVCGLFGTTAMSARWVIELGGSALESGGNIGSNFNIGRYSDAGAFVSYPLSIDRQNGFVTIAGDVFNPAANAQAALQLTGLMGGGITLTEGAVKCGIWSSSTGAQLNFGQGGTASGITARMAINNDGLNVVGKVFSILPADPLRGTYYFGNTGAKYLDYNGTLFTVSGGEFYVASSIVGTSIVYSRAIAAGNALFAFEDETRVGKGSIYWDRSSDDIVVQNASGGSLRLNANDSVTLAKGFYGRAGSAGAVVPNKHNLEWTGSLHAWVDTVDLGIVTVTSDYRIKKDVTDLPDMWDTVKALRPIRYTQAEFTPPSQVREGAATPMFLADDIERWGFIAHELQDTTVASAASCEKDAPNAIQNPNPWTVIAALTKALQEAMERIEVLESVVQPT